MKRIVWILAAALCLAACGEKDTPVPPAPVETLSVAPSALSFTDEDSSTKLVTVTSSSAWTASASAAWMHVSPTSGSGTASVSVKVDANTEQGARTGSISISAGGRSGSVSVTQAGAGKIEIVPSPAAFDGTKRASTTYQLLVYSFADSNGDGVGDFKGIEKHLDYLDDLGVTALWLSPVHPTDSYHGYDVNDYMSLNPLFGTEADFQSLIDAAHARGIAIYMDYVLNHSAKSHPWFKEAVSNPSSKYRDYYFLSANPSADYSKFPMLKGTTYSSGEWKQVTSGSPKLTITQTTDAVTNGNAGWNLWVWQDGGEGKVVKFVDKGDGTYYLVMDFNGKWGLLVRKYNNWDAGSKFGAKSGGTITEGTAMELVGDGSDMWFTGNGRYKVELTNVSTETLYYMGAFSDSMPDLNYGDVSTAENNACFQELAASADKWINMGVDGLRLDAVKHICGGINSYNNTANQTLLGKWYERCNATYKAAGKSLNQTENIFMVGEAWEDHGIEKQYYKGLISNFEFNYGGMVSGMLGNQNATGYVNAVNTYLSDHKAERPDAITSIFLTNHDQDRFAEWVGKNEAKEKQAAAILLSTPGKPFLYQGEELGYYGRKGSTDAPVRQPIAWDTNLTDLPKYALSDNHKTDLTDYGMVKAANSVSAQKENANSVLNVYRTWSRLRNTYPALARGEMTNANLSGSSIASWYMSSGSQKLLVVHNIATGQKEVKVTDSMSRPVALLGTAQIKEQTLILGANSSVVFQL